MRGFTHIAGAIALAPVVVPHPNNVVMFGAITGALMPDIDVQGSPMSKILYLPLGKHRGFFHTPLALAIFTILFSALSYSFGIGFFVGYLSHLILDTLNPTGIMWAYPIKRTYYSIAKIRVGSLGEYLILASLIIADYFAINTFLSKIVIR